MSHCIICNEPITPETDSDEHVIQNSVGGALTVRGFLHRDCNNNAGNSWDAEFARQTNPFCLFFQIVRDRGVSPPLKVMTTAGEELILRSDGGLALAKPSFSEIQTERGMAVSFTARNMREAKQMLEGAKAKYPNLDTDKALADATISETPPQGAIKLEFQIGGDLAGRSIVKAAAAFASHVGIDARACDVAAAYLRAKGTTPPFGYYDATDLILNREVGVPSHCVAVTGDPASGLLLGYLEYFGVSRMVVCLSESYNGPRVHHSYGINPLTGARIDIEVAPISFSRSELDAIFRYERTTPQAQQKLAAPIFDAAMRRKFEQEKNRAITEAVNYGFANCGARKGNVLTEEQKRRLAALIAHRMQPFLVRHLHSAPQHQKLMSEAP